MEFEISPEPEPQEREAILSALRRLFTSDAAPPAYRSAWRETGVLENVDGGGDGDGDEDDQAATRPRNNPGATRA